MKHHLCSIKGCINEGRYCRLHPGGELTKPIPVAPRSKKLEAVMKTKYRPLVKEMVQSGASCSVNSPVCTKDAQGFHHLQGRTGELLLNREKMIPCCNACNSFIEQNDAWARANGFKLSKFSQPITK